ncbi:hypothetical protein ES707_14076 [subsurface metagenome]
MKPPFHQVMYNREMAGNNLVLIESKFCEFQRFCRQNGFDLCYFEPGISGSKEDIERHQFDRPKVIKLKRHRFTSEGIPYDVAVWQQDKWRTMLPQLKDKFCKGKKEAGMADDKADELYKADRKRKWTESWVFFRLAVTSISAGILLVLVPSAGTVLPFIGFLLFLVSTLFLIAEWSRFSKTKWRNSRDNILWFGERMTPVFIMISIASVFFSWAKIIGLLYGSAEGSPPLALTWEVRFYSSAFLYWIIFFVLTLLVSVFRTETAIARKRPLTQVLKRVGLMLMLAAGVIGASALGSTNIIEAAPRDVLVFVTVFLTLLVAYYLLRDKKPPDPNK